MVIKKDINKDFQRLLSIFSSNKFLTKQGLGNEVPFFIYSYSPCLEFDIHQFCNKIINQLKKQNISVHLIDLYELSIEILREREILDQIIDIEQTVSKDELFELLQNVLDPEQHLIPKIQVITHKSEFDILFLVGVGAVFPYIRSHSILNNLQSKMTDSPTVLFFPGNYSHSLTTGASLDLFSPNKPELKDDRYYRAFNINEYEI